MSVGGEVIIRDITIVLMQTDFPDPVVPAIIKWGMVAKSVQKLSPLAFFPRRRGTWSRCVPFW
ncbi:Uncharacterised protein [Chlamydia trachomatis]|nr:Uncharacterised protein [Chlamydia trachomatis]